MPLYPLEAVQTVALHTQGLTQPAPPTRENIVRMVRQIGCVQIDTLQMVQRSHYLALWSRFGTYDPAEFDHLMFDADDRQFFEYWLHAACIIPLDDYRYRLPRMMHYRSGGEHWNSEWLKDPQNHQLMAEILEHIRQVGAVRSADFQHDDHQGGSWWGWKPSKRALEHLYNQGLLMIADRHNFQRVYDLAERVLPDWVDQRPPTEDEMHRYLLEMSIRALGVCQPMQIADYTHMKRGTARPYIEAMQADGTLVTVEAILSDGEKHQLVIHRDQPDLLDQAADGAIKAEHTTFLSPFDNLFWANQRDQQFWNFRQVLEAYKPAAQREWGYFCLPVLYKNQIIGRFDPKLERKTGILRLKALYLEPGIKADTPMIEAVAEAMQDFMRFHAASELVIETSTPAEFGAKLLKKLSSALC